jgi:hypothetical protein
VQELKINPSDNSEIMIAANENVILVFDIKGDV